MLIEVEKKTEVKKVEVQTKQFRRFSRLNRVLHVCMVVSFLGLALTGMTLKFSYTGWAVIMAHILGGFEAAGFVHRFCAVIMFGVFTAHITDLFRLKRKEYKTWKNMLLGPDTMLLNKKDLQDFIGSIKWFLNKGKRPSYGRWTYWEKFDYFAVFWGMLVIGSTGLTLWFPEIFTIIFPGSFINIATIIHSDEALLATGFIFTVHFFNTHLRPEKFPMDIVIFSGSVPVSEYKIDRPDEYNKLVAAGELDNYLVEPYQPIVIKTIKFFGWTALSIGFCIIIWIIYAMIFAYK